MRSARTLYVDAKARDWELLREVSRMAQEDAPHDLAFTDPALFRT